MYDNKLRREASCQPSHLVYSRQKDSHPVGLLPSWAEVGLEPKPKMEPVECGTEIPVPTPKCI